MSRQNKHQLTDVATEQERTDLFGRELSSYPVRYQFSTQELASLKSGVDDLGTVCSVFDVLNLLEMSASRNGWLRLSDNIGPVCNALIEVAIDLIRDLPENQTMKENNDV